jgi:signal transduction histidine kinase
LAQLQTGQFELVRGPLDLAAFVRTSVAAQRIATPQRVLTLHLPSTQPVRVLADADRLDQVVSNYLTNADKYSPAGQPVSVRLELDPDGWARVAVADHGPGIAPEQQAQVWERFQRAAGSAQQRASLGLGLYLSKTVIERHGGQVGLHSAPGQGTTFWFRLPLVADGDAGPTV